MVPVRVALLGLALVACAWFALGIRSVHDSNQVTDLINAHNILTATQARQALATLADARTLDPDESLNIQRAQVEFHSGDVRGAAAILEAVVRREPRYAEAWLVLELLTRQIDPATNRLAQAQVRQLVPPARRAR